VVIVNVFARAEAGVRFDATVDVVFRKSPPWGLKGQIVSNTQGSVAAGLRRWVQLSTERLAAARAQLQRSTGNRARPASALRTLFPPGAGGGTIAGGAVLRRGSSGGGGAAAHQPPTPAEPFGGQPGGGGRGCRGGTGASSAAEPATEPPEDFGDLPTAPPVLARSASSIARARSAAPIWDLDAAAASAVPRFPQSRVLDRRPSAAEASAVARAAAQATGSPFYPSGGFPGAAAPSVAAAHGGDNVDNDSSNADHDDDHHNNNDPHHHQHDDASAAALPAELRAAALLADAAKGPRVAGKLSALHVAARLGDAPTVRRLLAAGADPNVVRHSRRRRDGSGSGGGGSGSRSGGGERVTPLDLAVRGGHEEVVALLAPVTTAAAGAAATAATAASAAATVAVPATRAAAGPSLPPAAARELTLPPLAGAGGLARSTSQLAAQSPRFLGAHGKAALSVVLGGSGGGNGGGGHGDDDTHLHSSVDAASAAATVAASFGLFTPLSEAAGSLISGVGGLLSF